MSQEDIVTHIVHNNGDDFYPMGFWYQYNFTGLNVIYPHHIIGSGW